MTRAHTVLNTLLLTTLSLIILGWVWFLVSFHQSHDITSHGLFPAGPSFSDLTVYVTRFEVFRTKAFFLPSSPDKPRSLFAYPPGAALCYRFLYRWHQSQIFYDVIFFFWLSIATAYTWKTIHRATSSHRTTWMTCSIFLLSYPGWFLFQRSNIEIFLWIILFLSALTYARNGYHLAALGIGLAASIKLYPVLLLGLFLKDRKQWSALATGIGTAVIATMVEIWRCCPGFFLFGAHGFFGGVAQFQAKYATSNQGGNGEFDHSLFGWVKSAAVHSGRDPGSLTRPYYLLCGGTALLVYVLCVRQKPFLNRLTFLLVLMVLLPPVSFTYTLVHLYLPLLLLIAAFGHRSGMSIPFQGVHLVALVCLLFLLLPIDLFGPLVRSGGKIQVLPLLGLLLTASLRPWTEQETTKPNADQESDPDSAARPRLANAV